MALILPAVVRETTAAADVESSLSGKQLGEATDGASSCRPTLQPATYHPLARSLLLR
jgi:hypothetical protein